MLCTKPALSSEASSIQRWKIAFVHNCNSSNYSIIKNFDGNV